MMVDSVPFRMVLWLLKNPGRPLFSNDASEMFNVYPPRNVWTRSRYAVRDGWLIRTKVKGTREMFYEPGPRLLEAMQ